MSIDINTLNWIPLESSSLSACALADGTLYVRFRSGAVYSYEDDANAEVESLYLALTEAAADPDGSVGKAFHALVRHAHVPYVQIEQEDGD